MFSSNFGTSSSGSPAKRHRRTWQLPKRAALVQLLDCGHWEDNSQRDGMAIPHDPQPTETPRQVLEFAPKKMRHIDGGPMDQFGDTILAMLRKAADESNNDRTTADELSQQLHAAEDRITQLAREVQRFQDRAVRAEAWLQHIQQAIEQNLGAPAAAADIKSTMKPSN